MATGTALRPGEIKDILLREIEAADLNDLKVEEVGTVLEVKDGIARIYGLSKAMAGEMLNVTSSETGENITALALNLEEDNIGAVILGDYLVLKEGDHVRRTGRVLVVTGRPACWIIACHVLRCVSLVKPSASGACESARANRAE